MRNEFTLVATRPFELPGESSNAQFTAQEGCRSMISYKTKLSEYFVKRKAIGATFCAIAADAEAASEIASRSANTSAAYDAAHNALKAQFRAANQARLNALKELGPPPVMPT